ncbi:MAG: hypothetical protein ACI9VR_003191 [Cognaticolwellia sp.]|jgi:hypothetical protein
MTVMLLAALFACTSSEPEVEQEIPVGPFAYDLYLGCSSVEIISDGWNSGSDDYIETLVLNAFGQWDTYEFFAPYEGATEAGYIEYRSYNDELGLVIVAEGDAISADATDENQTFERDETGRIVLESLRVPQDSPSEYDATYTYVEDYEGCMAAARGLNARSMYRSEPCTTRIEYDYYMNGEVDEVATTTYDAEFRWVASTMDTNNDGTPENSCTYEWSDSGQMTAMDCTRDGYALTQDNTYDGDGRLVEGSVVNDTPNRWGEYRVSQLVLRLSRYSLA